MKSSKNIFLIVLFVSICHSQSLLARNQKIMNNLGFSSGIYANYGSSSLGVDGFLRIENNNGMFIESCSKVAPIVKQLTQAEPKCDTIKDVLKKELQMKYRRIQRVPLHLNSERNLILRQ